MSAQGNKENMRRVLREAFGQGNLAMMMPCRQK
jgi:hypothetical protein